jgi:hypothetical protein
VCGWVVFFQYSTGTASDGARRERFFARETARLGRCAAHAIAGAFGYLATPTVALASSPSRFLWLTSHGLIACRSDGIDPERSNKKVAYTARTPEHFPCPASRPRRHSDGRKRCTIHADDMSTPRDPLMGPTSDRPDGSTASTDP